MANNYLPAAIALGYGPSRLPVVHSHYVPVFAESHPRDRELQAAVCGQYVLALERHAAEPTCPACLALLAQQEPEPLPLIIGRVYDMESMRLIGWTEGNGTGHEGYQLENYFDIDGRYVGPDMDGIAPIVGER